MSFYELSQNNSGGLFHVDDKVCHRLIIEADSKYEAINKAEELGCYWDGVRHGMDCSCCGDRWDKDFLEPINLEKYTEEGYHASVYDGVYSNTIQEWKRRYGKFEVVDSPRFVEEYGVKSYDGKVRLKNIEEYAQFMADEYGWTSLDVRIYYKGGNVKEIYSHNR